MLADSPMEGSQTRTIHVERKRPLEEPMRRARPAQFDVKPIPPERRAQMQWWEIWEHNDEHRTLLRIDERTGMYDRFHYAAEQFSRTRQPFTTRALWDQFRIFAGLLGVPQVWRKRGEKSSDEEEDDEDALAKPPRRTVARPPYDLYGRRPQIIDDDSEIEPLQALSREKKEDKLFAFLDDPAGQTKVFLSYYMREQGFIWSDKNLTIMPRLVRSFLQFILRHRVFSFETDITKGFEDARRIADIALLELPLTSKLSKALPDKLSQAMKECWHPSEDPEQKFKAAMMEADAEIIDIESVAVEDNLPVEPEVNEWEGGPRTWDAPDPESLLTFLGPTTLPLTHTTGCGEWSLRRIKDIIPPNASNRTTDELDTLFTKVLLEPWVDQDGTNETTKEEFPPRLIPASSSKLSSQSHEPSIDVITMLATNASVQHMRIGMGIAGTWEQIVPRNGSEGGYWFMMALTQVLTGYHSNPQPKTPPRPEM